MIPDSEDEYLVNSNVEMFGRAGSFPSIAGTLRLSLARRDEHQRTQRCDNEVHTATRVVQVRRFAAQSVLFAQMTSRQHHSEHMRITYVTLSFLPGVFALPRLDHLHFSIRVLVCALAWF